jgi:energy-coupling factor transporter ATP-binding protein EcfA2
VTLLALRDAVFRYPAAREPALVVPTLAVGKGEFVAVCGPIGSGCSTLLLVAAGFAPRITGGTLEGERTLGARNTAVVFATPWTQLTGIAHTVLAEVAFGPASQGLPRDVVLDRARVALGRLGAGHLESRDPASLSGGELQRVIVAAALAQDPELLVLDDPAAELDPAGADQLYDLLGTLAREGGRGGERTVLVATPDVERVARVATRALVLAGGRIVADGAPRAVLDDTDVARIARAAGCPAPLPLDVASLVRRVAQ